MISDASQYMYTVVIPNALPMLGQWYITVLSIPGPLLLLDTDALVTIRMRDKADIGPSPCSRAAREARADPWVCRLKEKDSYTVIFVLKIRGAHIINSSSGYLTCGTCGTCGMWGDPPDRGQGSGESGVDQTPAARAF